jgi:bifunctional DNA-binding transcriptional regulator/antitoxin component of YhaV-PrlF toxin-antitoxin module
MMDIMEREITTIGTDGQLVLSPEIQSALGIHPGSHLEVSIKDGCLILQPSLQDRIDAIHRRFASEPSLEDELKEWRASKEW